MTFHVNSPWINIWYGCLCKGTFMCVHVWVWECVGFHEVGTPPNTHTHHIIHVGFTMTALRSWRHIILCTLVQRGIRLSFLHLPHTYTNNQWLLSGICEGRGKQALWVYCYSIHALHDYQENTGPTFSFDFTIIKRKEYNIIGLVWCGYRLHPPQYALSFGWMLIHINVFIPFYTWTSNWPRPSNMS